MKVKIYANENFPRQTVEQLRQLGYDVVTVRERGLDGQSVTDEAVLQYAMADSRAVVTHNRKDFKNLHRQNSEHCGIIICTVDLDSRRLAEGIDREIQQNLPIEGKLVSVVRPQISNDPPVE